MTINRRKFIHTAAIAGTAATATIGGTTLADSGAKPASTTTAIQPASAATTTFVATWPFGLSACQTAIETAKTRSMLDAVEAGIKTVEANVKNASVGIGGTPNAAGQVELDACIMSGPDHGAGSVAALQDILHPISVARKVMEETRHVMLVGENAKQFALQNGFRETDLLTDKKRGEWEKWKSENASKPTSLPITEFQHDTIAMIGVDRDGNMVGGCSTSGMGYKVPGRVGDSPIIGSGLYIDNQVGGAGATGVGENVMRYCASFLIVEFMRSGLSPTLACQAAIERVVALDPRGIDELSINFVALNKNGEYGAAGTDNGFRYAVATENSGEVLDALILGT